MFNFVQVFVRNIIRNAPFRKIQLMYPTQRTKIFSFSTVFEFSPSINYLIFCDDNVGRPVRFCSFMYLE
jgi:hypothetical protein